MNMPWNSNRSLFGAIGAALLGSVCCTVPLVLVSMGIGGAWLSSLTALAPLRPFFIAAAVGLLGFALGQYFSTRNESEIECDPGTAYPATGKLLGIGVVVTLLLIASPWMLPGSQSSTASLAGIWQSDTDQVSLAVDGMTCPSCSTTVITELNRTEGVLSADVTYDPPRAVVTYDESMVTVDDLITAISNTGYIARRASEEPTMDGTAEPMPAVELDELRESFNSQSDDVRVLAILSPTCSECIEGHNVMKQIFNRFDSDRLTGSIVWIPMRPGDDPSAATRRAGVFEDDRLLTQGWDPDRKIGRAFEETLELTRTAWDVYLIYEPGTTWEGDLPPKPSYWMHQLTADAGADQDFCLNPVALTHEVEKRLGETS